MIRTWCIHLWAFVCVCGRKIALCYVLSICTSLYHIWVIHTIWPYSSIGHIFQLLFITGGFLASRTCMLPDSLGKRKDSNIDPGWTSGLRSILTWHDLNSSSWLVWKPWKGIIFKQCICLCHTCISTSKQVVKIVGKSSTTSRIEAPSDIDQAFLFLNFRLQESSVQGIIVSVCCPDQHCTDLHSKNAFTGREWMVLETCLSASRMTRAVWWPCTTFRESKRNSQSHQKPPSAAFLGHL